MCNSRPSILELFVLPHPSSNYQSYAVVIFFFFQNFQKFILSIQNNISLKHPIGQILNLKHVFGKEHKINFFWDWPISKVHVWVFKHIVGQFRKKLEYAFKVDQTHAFNLFLTKQALKIDVNPYQKINCLLNLHSISIFVWMSHSLDPGETQSYSASHALLFAYGKFVVTGGLRVNSLGHIKFYKHHPWNLDLHIQWKPALRPLL